MCQISSLMAAAKGHVAEFSSFANFEEKKRKSNLLMSFLTIGNQMGSFGQIRKYSLFRFCRLILDIFGFTLLSIREVGFGDQAGRCTIEKVILQVVSVTLTVYIKMESRRDSTWAFCLRLLEMSGIIWVWRHLLFWMCCVRFLSRRSMLSERSCQERWKIITSLHTFLALWIFIVFVGTLDEDVLMIKVQTERDKGPNKWSLAFDLTKIKMFSGEDKWWRLVSKCWSFIVMNHGVVYWDHCQRCGPIMYPASSWFLLHQTREKPLWATVHPFELTALQRQGWMN